MATRQNLLIAEVNADTGAKVHHVTADGNGADDGGRAVAVDASGNAFAAGWTTDVTTEVVHAFVGADVRRRRPGLAKPIWLGPDDNEAYFEAIDLDAAGNPVCGGYGVQPGLGPEACVQAFWPTGGDRWTNVSSGSAAAVDICRSVLAGAGGVYAAGQVTRTSGGVDAQLKKIEP